MTPVPLDDVSCDEMRRVEQHADLTAFAQVECWAAWASWLDFNALFIYLSASAIFFLQ